LSCKFIAEWRARVASDLDWSDVPNLSRLSLIGAANGGARASPNQLSFYYLFDIKRLVFQAL
jgi:hypothetical protein